jgi:pyruvate,water dikinase
MCEIPSNVILADEFLALVDGYSIGSNDLTQLTLGLDRDQGMIAHLYDERNPAILRSLKSVIEKAKALNKKIGICGQAPSDFPEFAKFIAECGIDTISVVSESFWKTALHLYT